MNQTSPPVDIFHIAREEGILLAPGHYGEEFDGRIEFHPRKGKFILFYPEGKASSHSFKVAERSENHISVCDCCSEKGMARSKK
jgi:hypothetical protein